MGNFVEGRVAVVTGAASPIGQAIAARFRRAGIQLCLIDKVEMQEVKVDTEVSLRADLSDFDATQEAIAACHSRWSRIDILVNNAGGGLIRPFLDHDRHSLAETLDRNLWTCLNCCHAVLPYMVKANFGRIVNIGAESVRNGLTDHAGYNAAKGGVHGLTTGLAREFAPYDISVNVVAPSGVLTPRTREAMEHKTPLIVTALTLIPKGRLAKVDEVAAAVEFLASDDAGFITGQTVSVNGGSSMA